MTAGVGSPEPISGAHDLSAFACGNDALDTWLRERALANERRGAARTFVVTEGTRVIGFYSLAVTAILRRQVTGRARRNMPEPIPAMLLARLAGDRTVAERSLGRAFLRTPYCAPCRSPR